MYQEQTRRIDQDDLGNPNFVQVFSERMAEIPHFPEEFQRSAALVRVIPDTERVVRRVPTIVFISDTSNWLSLDDLDYHLWVEDPKSLDSAHYPHDQMEDRLRAYGSKWKLYCSSLASADLFENEKGERRLILDTKTGFQNQENIDRSEKIRQQWGLLARRYKLAGIYGDYYDYRTGEKTTIVGSDIVGQIREDEFLRGYAQRYGMTNFEWMRFRTRAFTAKEGQVSVKYDQLAQESLYREN
ncbi:MAG TPA: hypothetical protein VMR41_06440 [Patescibacteria group bacterium]|nr:hypothetical protein [Patescibacteria group bacterium]